MVVSLNYCSQNGGNLYRAPYYNGNPNMGPRIIGNLDQSPYSICLRGTLGLGALRCTAPLPTPGFWSGFSGLPANEGVMSPKLGE